MKEEEGRVKGFKSAFGYFTFERGLQYSGLLMISNRGVRGMEDKEGDVENLLFEERCTERCDREK